MDIEVCVVLYNCEDTIAATIRSLQLLDVPYSLALHDNSETATCLDVALGEAAALDIPVRSERCDRNCGFAAACNALARSSDATHILFLNPDAEILEWPGSHLLGDSIVGPVIVDSRGHVRPTWGRTRTVLDEALLRWARHRPRPPRGAGYVSGAAMLVPRDAFVALEGFDERFFMYYEDIDLCLRAGTHGVPVMVDAAWRVRHRFGSSARKDLGQALVRSYDSAAYFHEQAGHSTRTFRLVSLVDAALRLGIYRIVPDKASDLAAVRDLHRYIRAHRV